jgi:isocitrate/isopropylmalate dehydrogenase
MADRIMKAVVATLGDAVRTRDLGGTATTVEYADAICQRL